MVITMVVFLAVLGVLYWVGLRLTAPRPKSVEQHADEAIANLERPDLDLTWTSLDERQLHRFMTNGG